VDKEAVLREMGNAGTVVVNTLGPDYHRGLGPSRYGRPGRVPGSVNVPSSELVDSQTKVFVPLSEAQARFHAAGVRKAKRVIAYCGGGIAATVDLFLLHQLGYDQLAVYDGSLGEWARDETLPIETG
jgi:thiosulfate/3-mercaptopyruvate sulfurtransferase